MCLEKRKKEDSGYQQFALCTFYGFYKIAEMQRAARSREAIAGRIEKSLCTWSRDILVSGTSCEHGKVLSEDWSDNVQVKNTDPHLLAKFIAPFEPGSDDAYFFYLFFFQALDIADGDKNLTRLPDIEATVRKHVFAASKL